MGLDAYVNCTCFKTGKAKPVPFPQHYIEQDETGYIYLLEPYSDDPQLKELFGDWKKTGCEHENQWLVQERVANWWGYHHFQAALEKAGWEHFPVLQAELPEGNWGQLEAVNAPQALAELRYFREKANLGTHTVLVKTDSYDILYDSPGLFVWDSKEGGVYLGFDKHGFYIRGKDNPNSPPDLFRARRVEQRLLEPELTHAKERGKIEYRNLENGVSFMCTTGISAGTIANPTGAFKTTEGQAARLVYPQFLHVEERPLTADYFNYILDALTKLLEAANRTGNAVCWS